MAKIAGLIVFLLIIGFGLYEGHLFWREKQEVEAELSELEAKERSIQEENKRLQNDIEYYRNEANLEKEARSQFNYRTPEEQMMVVVGDENE